MRRRGASTLTGLLLWTVTACSLGGGGAQAFGTLVYTTPNTLPPPWTATAARPTPIAGWQAYLGRDVQLWLPSGFVGGDPVARREELLGIARASGPNYAGIVQTLEDLSEDSRFYAWELEQHETVVLITIDEAPAEESVEAYVGWLVDTFEQQFPEWGVVSQGTVQIAGQTVGRVVLDLTYEGGITRQITYAFRPEASVAGPRRAGGRFLDERFHLCEAGPELLHGDVDHAPDGDVDAPLWDPINEKRDCPPSRFQYSRADPRSAGPLSDGGYASDDPIPE